MHSVCESISATTDLLMARVDAMDVAHILPDALRRCDDLEFASLKEALAYFILHFSDRYGRADQVLENVLRSGYLPLRKKRLMMLDVGAGPAPSSYAVLDFYEDLAHWSTENETGYEVARAVVHPLDKGVAWDTVVHNFSEYLVSGRQRVFGDNFGVPFRRTYDNFSYFSVREKHNSYRRAVKSAIMYDFDQNDEYVDPRLAWQEAFKLPAQIPSAYDLIIVSNFLTSVTMTRSFRSELVDLTSSLTPGGVLIFLTGIGRQYPEIHGEIEKIAALGKLSRISGFDEPIEANPDSGLRSLVASQVRSSVDRLASAEGLSLGTWREIAAKLPQDVIDATVDFSLPKFRIFGYRRVVGRPSRKKQ